MALRQMLMARHRQLLELLLLEARVVVVAQAVDIVVQILQAATAALASSLFVTRKLTQLQL
jgi:type III secretory pathway component EscS